MHVSVHHTTTYYQQIGRGFPIVLLHGWGCDWQIWSPVIGDLSEEFQLVIPDLPLFGDSKLKLANAKTETPPAWDSFEYCKWLSAFIEAVIPGKPFILAGHSFGGKIAAIYAAQQASSLLKGLIIIDASGLPVALTTKEQITQNIAKVIPSFIKERVGSQLKQLLLQKINVASDYQQATEDQQAVLRKIVREDISHQLAQISLPSLVMWGKQDTTTPFEKGELFAELMANAQLVPFTQSGHYPFIDEPALFIDQVRAYAHQRKKTV